MKPNTNNPNANPGIKSNPAPDAGERLKGPPDSREEIQARDQLTEAGPNEIEGKKTNPFQRMLNSIWGPIRG